MPIQPNLDLLDPDPSEDETAKTKLLHALAQHPALSAMPATSARSHVQGDELGPSSPPHRTSVPPAPVHPYPTVAAARRGRSASTASSSPFTSGPPYRPYTNPPTSSSLMNLHTTSDPLSAPAPPIVRSKSTQHQTATSGSSMGRKSLEALVAALPENVLYGEGTLDSADRAGPPRSRLKSHSHPYPGFKPKRRRSPGRVRLSQRIKWVHGNFLEPLPFPDGHFDYV